MSVLCLLFFFLIALKSPLIILTRALIRCEIPFQIPLSIVMDLIDTTENLWEISAFTESIKDQVGYPGVS